MEQRLAGFGRSPGRLRHPHCPRHTTDSPSSWHCPRVPGSRQINRPQHRGFASSVGSKTTGQELAQPPRLPARPVAPTGPRQPLWVWVCPGGHTMTVWVTLPCPHRHPPCWSSPSPGCLGTLAWPNNSRIRPHTSLPLFRLSRPQVGHSPRDGGRDEDTSQATLWRLCRYFTDGGSPQFLGVKLHRGRGWYWHLPGPCTARGGRTPSEGPCGTGRGGPPSPLQQLPSATFRHPGVTRVCWVSASPAGRCQLGGGRKPTLVLTGQTPSRPRA